jgi:large repetitive protein
MRARGLAIGGACVASFAIFAAGSATRAATGPNAPLDVLPIVTGVSPSTGSSAGGTAVTVTGSGFTGATDVFFGGVDCSVVTCATFVDDSHITATTPAVPAGTYDVTVKNDIGTSIANPPGDQFEFVQPAPTVTNVNPNAGPEAGGTPQITLTGTDFNGSGFSATDLKFNGTDVSAATAFPCSGSSGGCFQVNGPTSISAYPPAGSGQVDITVTTASTDGSSVQTSAIVPADTYTYAPLPTVTGVSPAAGPIAGGVQAATVSGTGFTGATDVKVGTFDISSSPCPLSPTSPCFTVGGDTQITIGYFPAQSAGTVDITVTTPTGGTSLPTRPGDTYAYAPIPTVTRVSPNAGATAGGNPVTVTGTGFESNPPPNYSTTSVLVGSTPCAITTCYTVDSPTQITIVHMPPDSAGGMVDIFVTTVGGPSAANPPNDVYTYVAGLASVTSVSPANGPVSGKANIIITGTNFGTQGSGFAPTDVFFGNTCVTGAPCDVTTTPCPTNPTAACFNAVSSSKISVFTPAASAPGPVDVKVTTPANPNPSNPVPGDVYTYVAPGAYNALTPFRICDTRPVAPGIAANQCNAAGHGRLGPPINVQITGGPVPSHAQAVVVNLTAINRTSSGTYVSAYPAGGTRPVASNINLDGGAIHANLAIVALSSSGAITVFNAVGTVDVIVDVEGYFAAPGGSTSLGAFHSLAPVRICDTRANMKTECATTANNPIPGGTWRKVVVSGLPLGGTGVGIPTDGTAAAAVFNLTAVGGTQATFLAVAPPNSSDKCTGSPPASNVNPKAGEALPNRVISTLGPTQDICIFNSVGSVNFIVDVNGWFGTASAPKGAFFYSVSPTRICDTRAGSGTPCAGRFLTGFSTQLIQIAGVRVVPSVPSPTPPIAVVANLTGVLGSASTFFELYPSDAANRPGSSDLNPSANDVVANLAVFGLSTTPGLSLGDATLFNSVGTINAILDVAGWFQ